MPEKRGEIRDRAVFRAAGGRAFRFFEGERSRPLREVIFMNWGLSRRWRDKKVES